MEFPSILFLVIGIASFVGGLVWFYQVIALSLRAVKIPGEIVELKKQLGYFYPVVRFVPRPDNIEHLTSKIGHYSYSGGIAKLIGKKVTVLYDAKEPDKSRIGEFLDLWVFPCALTFIGIIFLLMASI